MSRLEVIGKRHTHKKCIAGLLLLGALTYSPAVFAVPNFQQAVAEYNAGKYAQALADFEQFENAYPSNGLIRYYEALCCQALNRLDKAKSHYQWVASNCQGNLKALGIAGMAKLANAHTQIASSGGTPTPPMAVGATTAGAAVAGGQTNPNKKVKKILEFYADW